MRSHPILLWTWRTVVVAVGSLAILAGLVMMVTPGPGIGGVILGLAILATEFNWARSLLRLASDHAKNAKEKALEKARQRSRKRAATHE